MTLDIGSADFGLLKKLISRVPGNLLVKRMECSGAGHFLGAMSKEYKSRHFQNVGSQTEQKTDMAEQGSSRA